MRRLGEVGWTGAAFAWIAGVASMHDKGLAVSQNALQADAVDVARVVGYSRV